MRTIKDKELHEKYCNICIDSPNSLFASLDESSKSIIRQTSICKMYRKGDLIYEEGNKPFGLICLITGKAKIAKKGIAGREQIVRMANPSDSSATGLSLPRKCTSHQRRHSRNPLSAS